MVSKAVSDTSYNTRYSPRRAGSASFLKYRGGMVSFQSLRSFLGRNGGVQMRMVKDFRQSCHQSKLPTDVLKRPGRSSVSCVPCRDSKLGVMPMTYFCEEHTQGAA